MAEDKRAPRAQERRPGKADFSWDGRFLAFARQLRERWDTDRSRPLHEHLDDLETEARARLGGRNP